MEVFEAMSKVAPVRVILGNHDCHDLNSNSINSVKPLGWLPNVTVYEEPELIELGGKSMLMMPWRANPEQEKQCLETFKKADYLFCHTDVKGADFNKWTKVDHGNEVAEFKSYKKVYTGHIHYRQKVGNINFVGCPYELTRSDIGNSKGYWILDTEKGTEEFVENPVSPRFIRFGAEEILEIRLDRLKELCKNNFVDVYIEESQAIDFPFQQLEELLDGFHRKLTFKTNMTSHVINEESMEMTEGNYDLDIMSISDRFISALSYETKLKDALKKYMKSLHNRVMETKGLER
jgi:hypothetical protein